MDNNKIAIFGCGWFGLPFAEYLVQKGYQVNGSTTSLDKHAVLKKIGIKPFLFQLENYANWDSDFFNVDVLYIAIPPKNKSGIYDVYLSGLAEIFKISKVNKIKHIILISSTSVFGSSQLEIDENTIPEPDSLSGEIILSAEQLFLAQIGFTKTILRFGGLIGKGRNLAKHFAGKTNLQEALTPINFIELNDAIGIAESILCTHKFGNIIHGVSPSHPTRKAFYTYLCELSNFDTPYFIDLNSKPRIVHSLISARLLNFNYQIQDWLLWKGNC